MSTHTDRTTGALRETMTLQDLVMRLEGIAARARGAGENITLGRAKNGHGALATIANEAGDLARHVREDLLYSHEADRVEEDLREAIEDDPGNDATRVPRRVRDVA